ncbi:ribosome-associated ATPase/putative transporter RbbA [Tropicimonas sp. TH_r6]|uniref:ribosome-associated ATPase/putative transporter RbbA n=1 Tax=Tropicimonas sp. TH_r6 TaxID=3082085 RepID=UPI002952A27A|nr:ribosome-associated ATPase/putative transporter RbbA [Tropicimonas sp. TH_r6]MDV7143148.1 ribosome-associated ATPase/putative transporter RbbA [Tropicimonas sp. TH_r6]
MTGDTGPVVRATDLTQLYGPVTALDRVTLELPRGQMVGLLGPDGVGKSTLLDLIAGARVMQGGALQVLGGDMRDTGHRRRTGPQIAYMPQGLGKNLYHQLSVQENLDFFGKLFGQGGAERRDRMARLTRATGLAPFLDRPAGKLSGGMKQKLGLCCALLHDPDLLILDEPTTGVDPLSRRQFWVLIAAIRAERPGMSVLVSTAYMDEAQGFDWLVAMEDGRVLDNGSPDELMAMTGTADIEAAFVRLLPEARRGGSAELAIPPLENSDGPPAITATGLTRRFGDFTAVDDVSFEIRPGEIFGFLGSNGCGKTTTMKMLTGLLPISEGAATLFGRPVDASDLATRNRVGFMTQAFSLYGELTVAQNLSLHARLFRMEPDRARERIATLSARFELAAHMDSRSGKLPLGIRQRLSLAVAVLHEPEILILDEPTSGVDPVARDAFWALLVELSRRDGVTIFISTHFMNEALRCDRISLMHAGRVLVYDTPAQLIAGKGADSLEEAFISYIEEATGGSEKETGNQAATLSADNAPARAPEDVHRFSVTRLLAFSWRETIEVLRDPVRLAFAFLGSSILLIVLTYGVSMDVDNIGFAALDQDRSPASRAYLHQLDGSLYFDELAPLASTDDLTRRMASGEVTVALEIPPGFERDILKGAAPEVSATIDGANTMRAGTVEAYVEAAHYAFLEEAMRQSGYDPDTLASYEVENRYRYNPTFESIYAFGPAIPAMLLMLFPAILMAISVAREKEIGTITNFYVTPTSRAEFLIGKQLPYIGITLINFAILTGLVVLALGVPLKGSVAALAVGALLYAMAVTSYGLLISTLTSSQVAAVFATSVLSLMPTVQFSGLIQPISTLGEAGQFLGSVWPASYFLHLSVGAYTKALGFGALWQDMAALAAFTPVFLAVAMWRLRKQER